MTRDKLRTTKSAALGQSYHLCADHFPDGLSAPHNASHTVGERACTARGHGPQCGEGRGAGRRGQRGKLGGSDHSADNKNKDGPPAEKRSTVTSVLTDLRAPGQTRTGTFPMSPSVLSIGRTFQFLKYITNGNHQQITAAVLQRAAAWGPQHRSPTTPEPSDTLLAFQQPLPFSSVSSSSAQPVLPERHPRARRTGPFFRSITA